MRYLPVFLLIGLAVLVSLLGFIIFNLRSKEAPENQNEETVARELPLEERPLVRLAPNSAGNELALSVSKIPVAVSVIEYELVYNTSAGVLQGVPGSVGVEGKGKLDRKLTLGTCSSGVCRYDKGVKDIKLTLKLRDSKGKLITRFSTNVNLQNNTQNLAASTGGFSLKLDKKARDYYIVMDTYGVPGGTLPGNLAGGPFGIFTSGSEKQSAIIDLDSAYQWDGISWKLVSGKTNSLGIFVVLAK